MSEGPRVLVVVPAWNEELSVAKTVEEIHSTNPGIDVLVIDDGSADRTATRADAAGAVVARVPINLGVGGAMRTGFRYAQRHGFDVVVQIDADGQHDPSFLPRLVDRLSDADVVIGARFASADDRYHARGPRRWAMVVLARTLSRLGRTRLTDVTSGYRAANRRAIDVFAAHYPAEYLGDTVESLVIALRTGCTLTQEPVLMRQRQQGQASQNAFRSTMYLARAMTALGLALVRRWPASFDEGAEVDSILPARDNVR